MNTNPYANYDIAVIEKKIGQLAAAAVLNCESLAGGLLVSSTEIFGLVNVIPVDIHSCENEIITVKPEKVTSPYYCVLTLSEFNGFKNVRCTVGIPDPFMVKAWIDKISYALKRHGSEIFYYYTMEHTEVKEVKLSRVLAIDCIIHENGESMIYSPVVEEGFPIHRFSENTFYSYLIPGQGGGELSGYFGDNDFKFHKRIAETTEEFRKRERAFRASRHELGSVFNDMTAV